MQQDRHTNSLSAVSIQYVLPILVDYYLLDHLTFVLALKVANGSYIMNGEFAVSAPGTYEAVGTRFVYSRTTGLDSVFAQGPTHHPIDIMVSV